MSRGSVQRLLVPFLTALVLLALSSGVAMAAGAEGGGRPDLTAGAIIGIVVSCIIAALVLGLSLGFILPKPPRG